LPVY